MKKIIYTQCGQPRPYADSIFIGTIQANSEQEAKDELQKNRDCVTPFKNKDEKREWWEIYFTELSEIEPGLWRFKFITLYTD